MDFNVRDVARLLAVSENGAYQLVRNGSLPAYRVGDQYRFNRVDIQEWTTLHQHRVSPDQVAPVAPAKELPGLCEAVASGGVFYQVSGNRPEEALKAVSELPGIPNGVDRPTLYQLLVARNALISTGMAEGIAIPHPRDPIVINCEKPLALLCFFSQTPDTPVRDRRHAKVLFLLLSPSVRIHLHILAKVAFALYDPALRNFLLTAAPRDAILDCLREIEHGNCVDTRDPPQRHADAGHSRP